MISDRIPESLAWLAPLGADYGATWLSLLATILLSAHFMWRHPAIQTLAPPTSSARAMAYYWPVLVWGIQALGSFRRGIGGCVAASVSAADVMALSIPLWQALASSALALIPVVSVGAALQYFLAKRIGTSTVGPVALPFSVLAAIAAVFACQLMYLFILVYLTAHTPR
jgi:hypothetical protein